jgi:hypothetical protein
MPSVAFVFRPAAEMVNGDETVDPFVGEQMFTPGVEGCAHELCALAGEVRHRLRKSRSVATSALRPTVAQFM